jgi:hypothetical protein
LITFVLGCATIGGMVLISPWCTWGFMIATCQPEDEASFNEGRWVIRNEVRGMLSRRRSLYRQGAKERVLNLVNDYAQEDDVVFFRHDGKRYSILDLKTDELVTYERLEDAPKALQENLKKVEAK